MPDQAGFVQTSKFKNGYDMPMSKQNSSSSELRIIAGKWRGRKVTFVPGAPGLRPTPNRVKETIFNWLAPLIENARCLDAFAGSGSLSFEALSRGAKEVVAVDSSSDVVKMLKQNAEILGAKQLEIYCGSFPEVFIKKNLPPFDIVFLDPPFHQHLVEPCAHWLEENNYLSDEAYISIEVEYELKAASLPANWKIIRNKKAGQVFYHLIHRTI